MDYFRFISLQSAGKEIQTRGTRNLYSYLLFSRIPAPDRKGGAGFNQNVTATFLILHDCFAVVLCE